MDPDRLVKLHFLENRTDSIDDVVRAIGNLGTSEDPTLQEPIITPVDESDLTRTVPRMRTLLDTRRDWL